MKRLSRILSITFIMVITALCISSCSKDDDKETGKFYTVFLKDVGTISFVKVDLYIYEYNDKNEKIATRSWLSAPKDGSKSFTSVPQATKVKIMIKMDSTQKWIQQVFYLSGDKNNNIVINGDMLIGNKEP